MKNVNSTSRPASLWEWRKGIELKVGRPSFDSSYLPVNDEIKLPEAAIPLCAK
jgi:hypothetical protein